MISELKKTTEGKMQKSVEALKHDLAKIRTGRAHVGLLDHVEVEYYGSMVAINQVANVTLIDARTIGVQAWEKGMAAKVEKAIRDSDLGLNPASDGDMIRVPMPALTEERRRHLIKVVNTETNGTIIMLPIPELNEERRRELTKVAAQYAESARVAVRNLRRDANSTLKDGVKEKEISEDDERRGQDVVQKLTDAYIAEIDKLLTQKEQELLQV